MKSRISVALSVFAFALVLGIAGSARAQGPSITAFPGRGVAPFGATFSVSPGECNVTEVVWNVGDAEIPNTFDLKDSLTFQHMFPWPGIFEVTATIYDGCGNSFYQGVTVLVAPDITPIPLKLKKITDSTNGLDAEFGLRFRSGYSPVEVILDFGDGQVYSGMAVLGIKHTYAAAGTYQVKATVLDVFGQTAVVGKQIKVE